jgi:hypothetical protein
MAYQPSTVAAGSCRQAWTLLVRAAAAEAAELHPDPHHD